MKTSELTGAALDWAVAKCEGKKVFIHKNSKGRVYLHLGDDQYGSLWCVSRGWAQGGPIIEREKIAVIFNTDWEVPNWGAWRTDIDDRQEIMGESPLIAAMRCYCCSKLGDEIEIPEELCQSQNS
jgi:hypothetical protein